MTYHKASYLQPSLGGRTVEQEVQKMQVIGAQSCHGANAQKICARATAEVQDKIWEVEVH